MRGRVGGPVLAVALSAALTILAGVPFPCGAAEAQGEGKGFIPAFPGAEGFGAYTRGGRGGRVYLVTTLADYDKHKGEAPIPGSLRAAVEAKGPRIVIFRVGGTIALKDSLSIHNPYITIAGQTAPGDGICLKGATTTASGAHDVIIRYLRLRLGDIAEGAVDAFSIYRGHDIIIDHCSASWSIDEVLSTQRTENVTVQWCIMAMPLDRSLHKKGAHAAGSLINGLGGISYHHNLYAHCRVRSPRVQDDVLLDFRNNVIYQWDERAGYNVQDPVRMNYIGNYLKPGPSTSPRGRDRAFWFGGPVKAYVAGNFLEGNPEATADNWLMMWPRKPGGSPLREAVGLDQPLPAVPVTTTSAEVAYKQVLEGAGATLPKRDSFDAMVVEQVKSGTGKFIDSQDEVGGWPELAGGQAPADTDADGMPDEWEATYRLNPKDASDNSGDLDGDGYTNVEEYINGTAPAVVEAVPPAVNLTEIHNHVEEWLAESHKIVQERAELVDDRVEKLGKVIRPAAGEPLDPAAAAKLPKKQEIDLGNGVTMELVLIPAGTFMMGSPPGEEGRESGDRETSEAPQHPVTISRPFYMAATEVTQAEYAAVTGGKPPRSTGAMLPAQASWPDAAEFCAKLSGQTGKRFRLPTEAEWEYACRAGTTTPFSTGQTISTDEANYDGKYVYGSGSPGVSRDGFTPVRSFPPNPWGMYDMHGNAYEWCYDTLGEYPSGPVTDPAGPDEQGIKVIRGGSYDTRPQYLRSASRYRYIARVPYGFRPVMEVE